MNKNLSLIIALFIVSICMAFLYHFISDGSGKIEPVSPVPLEVVEPVSVQSEVYESIRISEVLSTLTTRDKDDRVYSGQIKSMAGLSEFKKIYEIDLDADKVNFDNQMLIFGVTDEISTRAFQFIKNAKIDSYVLDYYDSGIQYKLAAPGYGKKYSQVQVFVLKKTEGISHVRVKNFVKDGLSKVYED